MSIADFVQETLRDNQEESQRLQELMKLLEQLRTSQQEYSMFSVTLSSNI
jgi:hypothetical protein